MTRAIRAVSVAAIALSTIALTVTTASSAPSPATERVTVSATGEQSNGASGAPGLSADGRYAAFSTNGSNLVPGDTNGTSDSFLRDLRTGTVERVSVASDGTQGDGSVGGTDISGNGRYVIFSSSSTNLVDWPGPSEARGSDVYVHDRRTGRTERVSTTPDGGSAGAYGSFGISHDGRYVAFNAPRARMEAGQASYHLGAYLADRRTGEVKLISTHDNPEWTVYSVRLSGNGRSVAYDIRHPRGGRSELRVHDRVTGAEEQANVNQYGDPSSSPVTGTDLSYDGRTIAFSTLDEGLTDDTTPATSYVFVRDLRTDTTRRVDNPEKGERALSAVSLSPDGRYVAYDYSVPVPGGEYGNNVFVYDLRTGATRLATESLSGGKVTEDYSAPGAFSGNGRLLALVSTSPQLVPDDTNGHSDGFVRRLR
ncbi:hypothetical protein [Streptomyces vastus]|uniref:PD40 domain-containing protein n=1 Tax=Streptomyces vastus TaxID=285451 RepID=A0ABN3R484_9ACTN